jgi:hypothetical protein
MREPHLDALSLVSRSGEHFWLHPPTCDIAGVFVDVARNLARSSGCVALRPYGTCITVALRSTVEHRLSVVWGAAGLAIGQNADPLLPVPADQFSQTGMCVVSDRPRNLPSWQRGWSCRMFRSFPSSSCRCPARSWAFAGRTGSRFIRESSVSARESPELDEGARPSNFWPCEVRSARSW